MLSQPKRVAVIVDRYPCLSESFVRRESALLARMGFAVTVVACRGPTQDDAALAPQIEYPIIRPPRWNRAPLGELLRAAALFPLGAGGLAAAWRAAGIAGAIRSRLAQWKPNWIHAHFLGMPAAVGCLLAADCGAPLSLSAHARDVFVPAARLTALCSRARFVAACSQQVQASLIACLPPPLGNRVVSCPHGVDLAALPIDRPPRNALQMLSVCRLVPKKGIDVVLRALALLPPDLRWRYRIAGGGPELPRLRALARQLHPLGVEFLGPLAPDSVARELEHADLFVLGARTAPDGDRDGIPNAVLEAMVAGVPVVASDGGAISEIISHRRTGWLAPSGDPAALAHALEEAARDAGLRQRIAARAARRLRRRSRIEHALARRLASEMESR